MVWTKFVKLNKKEKKKQDQIKTLSTRNNLLNMKT